jgi:dihydropteroate synthase
MQNNPGYRDAPAEVWAYLYAAADRARAGGIDRDRIILDPGIGFGKRLEDNLSLIRHFPELCGLGYPVLMALSRKTFIGEITGQDVAGRLAGTIAANAASIMAGARMVRVHDVKEAVDMVKVLHAIMGKR